VHVAATDHSSDVRLTSRCLSLLQTTVATRGFYPSLLCYHCIDAVVATGRMPAAQWLTAHCHNACLVNFTDFPVMEDNIDKNMHANLQSCFATPM
jgi:hypothetical protein